MSSGLDDIEIALTEGVEYVISDLSGDVVTLPKILNVAGREEMLVYCVFLTLPFMALVSIPGVNTVFGLVMGLVGVGIMTDHRIHGHRFEGTLFHLSSVARDCLSAGCLNGYVSHWRGLA